MKKRIAYLLRSWAFRLDPQTRFQIIHDTIQSSSTSGLSYTITFPKPDGGGKYTS